MRRTFSRKTVFELRLLIKMQYSLDITSKVRMKRSTADITRGSSIKLKGVSFGNKNIIEKVSQRRKKLKEGILQVCPVCTIEKK